MIYTASKTPLLMACSWWSRDDVQAPEAESGLEARIGTVVGARLAAVLEHRADPGNVGLSETETDDADAYFEASKRWAEKRGRIGTRCEVAYAWSPSKDEARELKRKDPNKLRDYSAAKGDEVCGSVDLEDFDMDGAVLVEDMKTGFTPLESYIPQVAALGLFAARAHKVRKARVRLVKLFQDREPEVWERTLDGFALDAVAVDLRERLEGAKDASPMSGSHCTEKWCPARLVCPEAHAAVENLIPADQLARKPRLTHEFISHDHDAKMLEFLRLVSAWGEDMKGLIKARTPKGGVVLSDGRILEERHHDEVRWKQAALIEKARELGARAGLTEEQLDVELETCRQSFQKSQGLRAYKALTAAKKTRAA